MLRDKDIPTDDGYAKRPFIMESAKELQELSKCLPDTADLPTSHEYFVETVAELRSGQTVNVKYVGVRRRVDPVTKQPAAEPDNLNALGEADLEDTAVQLGIPIDAVWKKLGKAKRVERIREAQKAKGKAMDRPADPANLAR